MQSITKYYQIKIIILDSTNWLVLFHSLLPVSWMFVQQVPELEEQHILSWYLFWDGGFESMQDTCVLLWFLVSPLLFPSSWERKAQSVYKSHWESPGDIYLWPEREDGAEWLQPSSACHSICVVAGPVLNPLCTVQLCNYKLVKFFLCLTSEWRFHLSFISFPWNQVWPAPRRCKNYKTKVLNENFVMRELI